MTEKLPVVLCIAGSDNTGGAGIQADIKTCCHFHVYACSAITAVTAQNCHGVSAAQYVGADLLRLQLSKTLEVMRPDAVKIGMLPCPEAVDITADAIEKHCLRNVVLDPVLSATSGGSLSGETCDTTARLFSRLFPLCEVVTPNLPESVYLLRRSGSNIEETDTFTEARMKDLALRFKRAFKVKNILLKGGHLADDGAGDIAKEKAKDDAGNEGKGRQAILKDILLGEDGIATEYEMPRIMTPHTHGTGCALSSAIACGLAEGKSVQAAVAAAKRFLARALRESAEHPVTDTYGPLYYF